MIIGVLVAIVVCGIADYNQNGYERKHNKKKKQILWVTELHSRGISWTSRR